jgi:hypothetical protein
MELSRDSNLLFAGLKGQATAGGPLHLCYLGPGWKLLLVKGDCFRGIRFELQSC